MKAGRSIPSSLKTSGYVAPVSAAVILLGAGIYGVVSWMSGPHVPAAPFPVETRNLDDYEKLEQFVRTSDANRTVAKTKGDTLLPDVDTMIERLATRLEAKPDDSNGWQMLGWSYFQVGRYEESASAYARALKIEPGSAELKVRFSEAKAKTSTGEVLDRAPTTREGKAPLDAPAELPP